MTDQLDVARLLLDLEVNDGWTIIGAHSAQTKIRNENVRCFFFERGARISVQLFVGPKATSKKFTSDFDLADFQGEVERSISGSKFERWIFFNVKQAEDQQYGAKDDLTGAVWTRAQSTQD